MYAEEIFASLRDWRGCQSALRFLLANDSAVALLSTANLSPRGFVHVTDYTTRLDTLGHQHGMPSPTDAASSPLEDAEPEAVKRFKAEGQAGAHSDVTFLTSSLGATRSPPLEAAARSFDAWQATTVTCLVVRANCCQTEAVVTEAEREALTSLDIYSCLLMHEALATPKTPAVDRNEHTNTTGKRFRDDLPGAMSPSARQRQLLHSLLQRAHADTCPRHVGLPALRLLLGVQSLSLCDSLLIRAHCAATEGEVPAVSADRDHGASTATRRVTLLPRATPPSAVRRLAASTMKWLDVGAITPSPSSASLLWRYKESNTHPLLLTTLLRLKRARDVVTSTVADGSLSPAVTPGAASPTPTAPAATGHTHVPESDAEAQSIAHQVALLVQLHGFAVSACPALLEPDCVDRRAASSFSRFEALANGRGGWSGIEWCPVTSPSSSRAVSEAPRQSPSDLEVAAVTGPEAAGLMWDYLSHTTDTLHGATHCDSSLSATTTPPSSLCETSAADACAARGECVRCHYCGAYPGVELLVHRQPIWETVKVPVLTTETHETEVGQPGVLSENELEPDTFVESMEDSAPRHTKSHPCSSGSEAMEETSAAQKASHVGSRASSLPSPLEVVKEVPVERSLSPADVPSTPLGDDASSQPGEVLLQDAEKQEAEQYTLERRLVGYSVVHVQLTLSFLAHDQLHSHYPGCPWRELMLSKVMDTRSSQSSSLLAKPLDFLFARPQAGLETAAARDEEEMCNGTESTVTHEATESTMAPGALPPAPSAQAAPDSAAASSPQTRRPFAVLCLRFQRYEVAALLTCWGRSEEQEMANARPYLTQPLPRLLSACRRDASLYRAPAQLYADGSASDARVESRVEAFLAQLDTDTSNEARDGDEQSSGAQRRWRQRRSPLTAADALVCHAEAGGSISNVLDLLQRAQALLADEASEDDPNSEVGDEEGENHGAQDGRYDKEETEAVAVYDEATRFLNARATTGLADNNVLQELFGRLDSALNSAFPLQIAEPSQSSTAPPQTSLNAPGAVTALIHAQYGSTFLPVVEAYHAADNMANHNDSSMRASTSDGAETGAVAEPERDAAASQHSADVPRVRVVPTTLATGLRTPSMLSIAEQTRIQAWLATHMHTVESLCATPAVHIDLAKSATHNTHHPHVAPATTTPIQASPVAAPASPSASPAAAVAPAPPARTQLSKGSSQQTPAVAVPSTSARPKPAPRQPAAQPQAQSQQPPRASAQPQQGGVLGAWSQSSGGGRSDSGAHHTKSQSDNHSPVFFSHRNSTSVKPVGATRETFGQLTGSSIFAPAPSAFQMTPPPPRLGSGPGEANAFSSRPLASPTPTPVTSVLGNAMDTLSQSAFSQPAFAPGITSRTNPSQSSNNNNIKSHASSGPSAMGDTAPAVPAPFGSGSLPLAGRISGGGVGGVGMSAAILPSAAPSVPAFGRASGGHEPAASLLGARPSGGGAGLVGLPSTSVLAGTPSTSFRSILGSSALAGSESSTPHAPSPSASMTKSLSPPPTTSSTAVHPTAATSHGGNMFGAPTPLSAPSERPSIMGTAAPGTGGGFGSFAQASAGRGFTFQAPTGGPTAGASLMAPTGSVLGGAGGSTPATSGGPVFGFNATTPLNGTPPPPPSVSGSAISGFAGGFGRPSVLGRQGRS